MRTKRTREEAIADAIVLACVLALVAFFLFSNTVELDRILSKG